MPQKGSRLFGFRKARRIGTGGDADMVLAGSRESSHPPRYASAPSTLIPCQDGAGQTPS